MKYVDKYAKMHGLEKDTNVLVVLSGGQDSTTCLKIAQHIHAKVYGIHFTYGQRHALETSAANSLHLSTGVDIKNISLNDTLLSLSTSALLDTTKDVNGSHELKKHLPASYLPGRNALFLTLAHTYAQKIKAKYIYTGVCQTDYSGYPDCRSNFIDAIEKALNEGSEQHIEIMTPLMFLNKAQIFAVAVELNCLPLIIYDTHTCYNNSSALHIWGKGCGECPACKLRSKGYTDFINKEYKKF